LTAQRRAGAPRLIEWTGERCVPWAPDVQVVYEHLHRYLWASRIVAGRRVLDLGSGEGFGAAILADKALEVVGIDIDERTVEHSQLNYAGPGLSFSVGSAIDLSRFDSGTFGAVVAFEIIEHVSEQEQVLDEIARVLDGDGLLVLSTPDRRLYSEATGQNNAFHVRELSLDELSTLVGDRFAHHAVWGQRTITGSHIGAVSTPGGSGTLGSPGNDRPRPSMDFFVERSGEDWRQAPGPAPMYLLAVGSQVPLADIVPLSTLADPGVALLRATQQDASSARAEFMRRIGELEGERDRREASDRAELEATRDLDRHIQDLQGHIQHLQDVTVDLRARAEVKDRESAALSAELVATQARNLRLEGSVTIQLFRKLSNRVYSTIGEQSLLARVLRATLRGVGRLAARTDSDGAASAPPPERASAPLVELPQFDQPAASLIIPLHARADLTLSCLESICDNTAPVPYEVILIDDDADPETRSLLARVAGAHIMRNKRNAGYLRSVNRAAAAARGRWLVLCNNDIEVRPGWLEALLRCGDSAPDIGVVTPKYLNPDGHLSEAGGIVWRDGNATNYGRGDSPSRPQYEYRRETDYGSAAALLVRGDLWRERGGFDERFLPMYYEDVDLCFDARERGLRVMYEPEAVVIHHEGATAGTDVGSGAKRHQEANRPKFVSKWRHRLETDHIRADPTVARRAADRNRGSDVLIIDSRIPMPDRDAGSLRMLHILETLRARGCRVAFVPDNFMQPQPYTRDLQRRGVQVLANGFELPAELAAIGPDLSLAILSRPHQASRWLDLVRETAPNALVAYDTVDLHWLREARRAGSRNGRAELKLVPKALALRELELAMVRATDVTLVVSDAERERVEADVPSATVRVVPTVHALRANVPPPERRSGVLFVGGFEHPPNIDAAVRLVRDVMPLVWRDEGDVAVTIVGPTAPSEVEALASERVEIAGWVPDLEPLLGSARVLVAPLNYGAGLKGKITQSLAAGLPVVTTPIGAEGLHAIDGQHLMIAEHDRGLANRIIEVLRDSDLWRRLSDGGRDLIGEHCSLAVMDERLGELLSHGAGGSLRRATPGLQL
jgi:GT2 family glycosyltransferase/SAM-dependent methyltransferase